MKVHPVKLRQLRSSPGSRMRADFEAYLQRVSSRKLTWRDLISALDDQAIIAEDAALLLHRNLKINRMRGAVVMDPKFWLQQLARRQLAPGDRIVHRPNRAA